MFSTCFDMEELSPERSLSPKRIIVSTGVVLCLFALCSGKAQGQGGSGYSGTNSDSTPAASIKITAPSNQNPFGGSVAQGTAKPEVMSLTFQDAIDLGLKNNLGVLLQSYNSIAARGAEMEGTERASPERAVARSA